MGNCCTTTTNEAAAENPDFHTNSKQNRTPPPSHPLLEEESVKEVLSEIPTVPRKPIISRTHQENNEPRKCTPMLPNFRNIPDGKPLKDSGLKKPTMIFNPEELSEEAPEICSTHSESISTATYFTEKNDEDVAEIRQRSPAKLHNRLLSGDVRMRERFAGRSPTNKSDPCPSWVRSGSDRDTCSLGPNVQKRDCGESSGRRSRSPATRTDGGGAKVGQNRSSSARRTGRSPGRVRSEVGEKIRKLDGANTISSSSNGECGENRWPPTSNESLENPLVSLECFIFL